MLLGYEQEAIDQRSEYNIAPVAGSQLGVTRTEETNAKNRAAKLGRKRGPMSQEQKAKISATKMGHEVSDEARANLREAAKGNTSGAGNKGHKHTAETKAKRSAALKGKPWSPARRAAEEARKARKEND